MNMKLVAKYRFEALAIGVIVGPINIFKLR